MPTDYTAAWSTLDSVALVLGATVEPDAHGCDHLRTLRLSPFLWCHVSARGQHWNSPAGTLHITSPHSCGARISANLSISRPVAHIAADLRRRVLDPLRDPLRKWHLAQVQKANEESAQAVIIADLGECLGEPLELCCHSRKFETDSRSCAISQHDVGGSRYDGREEWRAEIRVDSLAAFKMILRIVGECQKLKPKPVES